jgi:hypothetical protein
VLFSTKLSIDLSLVFVLKICSKAAIYIMKNKVKCCENTRFVVWVLVAGYREQDIITFLDYIFGS